MNDEWATESTEPTAEQATDPDDKPQSQPQIRAFNLRSVNEALRRENAELRERLSELEKQWRATACSGALPSGRGVLGQLGAEERLRIAAEVAKVGTFEWHVQTNINIWTPELEALYGIPAGGFAGSYEAWAERVHPDDRAEAERKVRDALHTGTLSAEWRTTWPDGTVRWLEARAWVEKDAEGNPLRVIGVNLDITDRKRAEQAVEEANRRKDDYLAMLGHELRNPLAAIRTTGDLIKLESASVPALTRAAQVLERQSAHMAALVDGLLDVSRLTRGKLSIEKTAVDLVPILNDVLFDRAAEAERKHIDLRAELADKSIRLQGDPPRLVQIFEALLGNAIKFTGAGGTVTLAVHSEAGDAIVAVRDDGIGFSPQLAERLFEPFQQGPQDIARSDGGLGLGLALTQGLVDLHGGSIEAHSDGVGQGAEFIVRLPIEPQAGPHSIELIAPR